MSTTLPAPVAADNPAPHCETIQCPCFKDGKPADREVLAVYRDDYPLTELARLFLYEGWSNRKRDWKSRREFRVEEIGTSMDGRAFILHRSAEAIAADPDHEERYATFIGFEGQGDLCECKGHASHGYCVHTAVLRGLLAAGRITDPRHDPRPAACHRCHGDRQDPDVRDGICGTCAQDLMDEAQADAAVREHDANPGPRDMTPEQLAAAPF